MDVLNIYEPTCFVLHKDLSSGFSQALSKRETCQRWVKGQPLILNEVPVLYEVSAVCIQVVLSICDLELNMVGQDANCNVFTTFGLGDGVHLFKNVYYLVSGG